MLNKTSIESLPTEIIWTVLSELSLLDVMMVSNAIPSWKSVTMSPFIWETCALQLTSSKQQDQEEQMKMTSLHNQEQNTNSSNLKKSKNTIRIDDAFLEKHRNNLQYVRCLEAPFGGLSDHHLVKIIPYLTGLQRINLTNCQDLTRLSIKYLIHHCGSTLTHINLNGITCMDDALLRQLALSCPKLDCIDISKCPKLTRTGILNLIDLKPNLSSVSLSALHELSYNDWSDIITGLSTLTQLRNLDLSKNYIVDKDLLSIFKEAFVPLSSQNEFLYSLNVPSSKQLRKKKKINHAQCNNSLKIQVLDCEKLTGKDVDSIQNQNVSFVHNCVLYDYSKESILKYLDTLVC